MNTRDDEKKGVAINTHWYEIVTSMIVIDSFIITNPTTSLPRHKKKYRRDWKSIIRTNNFTEACELYEYYITLDDFISVDLILHTTLNGNRQDTIKQSINERAIELARRKARECDFLSSPESDD